MTFVAMKIKVLSRNPDDYLRETKKDIHKGKLSEFCKVWLGDVTLSELVHVVMEWLLVGFGDAVKLPWVESLGMENIAP